jgi:hypothetical protein
LRKTGIRSTKSSAAYVFTSCEELDDVVEEGDQPR